MTGKLAEPALREVASELAKTASVEAGVIVLNIQVAALMTADWVARKLSLPAGRKFNRVLLPGYCKGDLSLVAKKVGVPVERGPQDLRDLPEVFGQRRRLVEGYGEYDIEIIAEVNHAADLSPREILRQARELREAGADVIDVGCDPYDPSSPRRSWKGLPTVVRLLRDAGLRVSVDTFDPKEAAAACRAGAELVLSVNSSNRAAACDWGAEVVVVPDVPRKLGGLDDTVAYLEKKKVRFRIDPVLEPIGMGLAASLGRYLEVRRRYPGAAVMMGVGNLTELTEVDSAGVNALLLGFCQEAGVRSVLTTQVINWCRSAVRELDVARRLMRFAVRHRVPPKHVDDRLVMLRDRKLRPVSQRQLKKLADGLTDRNVRLFADPAKGLLHAMHKDVYACGADPFVVFDQLGVTEASHAFYLGYEMAKAMTAITLGKNYTQDQALSWGMLTRAEASHFERRKKGRR